MVSDISGSLKIRTELKDRYLLLARLGSGGMADVYLGMQRGAAGFEQLVVIKRIKAGNLAKADESTKLFIREARTVAQLSHPHIVKVFDLCRMGDAVAIVMEYLDGENLEYVARALSKSQSQMPLGVLCRFLIQACEALHYAHNAKSPEGKPLNLIHRDVGPHNLMLDSHGYLKVIDFGIAKTTLQMDLTSPGVIKGKVSYLAPDCFMFQDIDHRIDVYAMGLVLWRLLTLKVPYDFKPDATLAEIIKRLTTEPLPPPSKMVPGLPQELDRIVARAAHQDRKQRYQSCQELAQHLQVFAESHGGLAPAADAQRWFEETFRQRIEKRREFERAVLEKARQMVQNAGSQTIAEAIESVGGDGTPGSGVLTSSKFLSTPPAPGKQTRPSMPAITSPAPPPPAVEKKGGLKWLLVAVAVLILAGGALATWRIFLHQETPPPVAKEAAVVEDNLVVFSAPPGAEVFIDGQRVGVTGLEGFSTRIKPGAQHLVEVRKEGFVAYQVQVLGQEQGRVKLEALLNEVVSEAPAQNKPEKQPTPQPDTIDVKQVRVRQRGRPVEKPAPRSGTEPDKTEPSITPQEPEQPITSKEPEPKVEKPAPPPVEPREEAKPQPPENKEPVTAMLSPSQQPSQPKEEPRLLSGSGRWDGETALTRGCGSCHNGSKARVLVFESKTQSQWEFFFQRQRHNRYAELEKLFSREELKAALQAIVARIAKKEKSGIAGER